MTKTRPGGSIFNRCQGVNFQAVLTIMPTRMLGACVCKDEGLAKSA